MTQTLPVAWQRGASDERLEHVDRAWPDLAVAARLLDQHLDEAVRAFGSTALGAVALPPLTESTPNVAQLRVAAVLLWTREVEAAGLPRFSEALAEGMAKGTLLLPLGRSSIALMRYWRGRTNRLTSEERQAVYARLMGGDSAGQPSINVEGTFERLVSALDELGRWPMNRPRRPLEVRIATLARELAARLSARAVGMAAFAARDIVAHIRQAARLLRDPELVRALGGRSLWETIQMHAPHVLGHALSPQRRLSRARAGRVIVAWLASIAPTLASGGTPAGVPRAVIDAAVQWRSESPPHSTEEAKAS